MHVNEVVHLSGIHDQPLSPSLARNPASNAIVQCAIDTAAGTAVLGPSAEYAGECMNVNVPAGQQQTAQDRGSLREVREWLHPAHNTIPLHEALLFLAEWQHLRSAEHKLEFCPMLCHL